MNEKIIARVNNVNIVSTSDEQLVAIKPICEALGIAYQAQQLKIKEDEDLSSVNTLSMLTGADGKQYEMLCLPIRYIFGWLFTINSKNVKSEAQDSVRAYRRMCYDALYNYFFGGQKRQIEQNQAEISLLECLADCNQQKEVINKRITDTKRKLEKLREERLKDEPTLF